MPLDADNATPMPVEEADPGGLYAGILEVACSLMRSETASIQKLVPEREAFLLVTQRGLAPESARFWEWMTAEDAARWGLAPAQGEPVIVTDVEASEQLAGTRDLDHCRLSGIRATLWMPLVSREGHPLGILAVQWRQVHRPSESELRLLAVLARQAADLIERRTADVALRSSEERYRTLFNSIDQGFCVVEMIFDDAGEPVDYRFVEANPAFESQTGLVDAVGKRMRALAAEHEAFWFETYGRIARTGKPERFEHCAEALGRWFSVYARQTGAPQSRRVAVLFDDITERKRAEAALRKSEERLLQFGEASQDVLWIRDVVTLQWVYLTPAFETIYGLSREEVLAGDNYRSWQDLIVPEDRDHAVASIARVRAGAYVTFEYRIRRPSDGTVRWMRDTDFPIVNDAGEVVMVGGIGNDFTDVREIELRLKTLVEGMPQLVWRAADIGEWTWASPQWRDYTGQDEADYRGSGWLSAVHPDDRVDAREAWSHAAGQSGFEVEYRVRRQADGAYRWFQTRAAPVCDHTGHVVEWLGTSTDINDLRELQDRQRELVGELQHRTRNLMGVVRSMADKTARASADLPDFRGRFRDRLQALARAQGLLSRLDEHDRVTFDELIEAEISAVHGDGSHVTLKGPGGVRLRSSTVQTLAMAVHELATNAVKYGALGQPGARLRIEWSLERSGADGGPWLHVDWRESGVDMPAEGAAPGGTGQGRELIENALPYQFGAKTSYALGRDGVHCTISVPASAIASAGKPSIGFPKS